MESHGLIYLGLTIAYAEAAMHNFDGGNVRSAVRATVIALLYASTAWLAMQPAQVELVTQFLVA